MNEERPDSGSIIDRRKDRIVGHRDECDGQGRERDWLPAAANHRIAILQRWKFGTRDDKFLANALL